MKSILNLIVICTVMGFASAAPAETVPGSDDWHFDMSKAIAIELADTPAWSLAMPYLHEIGPKTQDWNILLLQARVELQRGDVKTAQSLIERALSAHPKNPRILAMAGNIAADAGEQDKAVGYFESVLSMQPDNTQVLMALGRIRSAQSKWQDAIDIYQRLLKLTMPTAEICSRLASACENTGDLECAEKYLVMNLDIHPNRALALLPLERFYRRHQKTDKANDIARELSRYKKNENENRELRALQKSAK